MPTESATWRRRSNRLARRKQFKEKKKKRSKVEFEKTIDRIAKVLPTNADETSFLRERLYLEAKACGIDLTTRQMRKKEPGKSKWCKKGRDNILGKELLHPIDNSVSDWFQTLEYDEKVSLYLISRPYISNVDLKPEGIINNAISLKLDFNDWGRLE